ncbi:Crp/Fnr family transcriptional regulator [Azospira restricta]|uniref:Crp/Fnr family transcriptional regulator n=1 Tax=Azospira restricta TaxID=404405 RepID=A0A974Y3E7_9RHOO|nr:Crp/Fnr family transcriptional regulator [Azospira restricta]QRJ63845.1 Crp/Fnr family transcriptional regulator [Azospira restricta]
MGTVTRERLLTLYPALADLPAADLDRLLQPAALLHLPAGTRIFAEREPCRGFPLVVDGSIKVVKTAPSGREMLLYRVAPGDSCIISSSCLLGRTPYTARGESESAVTLAVLPEALFERLLAEHRAFRDFVFHLLAERIADLMQRVEEVAFHRLDQRLARLLLARGDDIHATHQALADELGSVREIVSRLLKGFAAEGLVELGRERILLRDRDGLRRVADSAAG